MYYCLIWFSCRLKKSKQTFNNKFVIRGPVEMTWSVHIKRIGTKIHWAFCNNWSLNSIDYINLIFNDIQHQIWLRIWICWKDLIINQVPEEKINHPNLIIRGLSQNRSLKIMQYFQFRNKLHTYFELNVCKNCHQTSINDIRSFLVIF